jgi:ADP-heptose:LPS heptosyltransferase
MIAFLKGYSYMTNVFLNKNIKQLIRMSLYERQKKYWEKRRKENEDIIPHPNLARLKRQVINILRRIVCAVLIPFWKKYRKDTPFSLDDISSILLVRNDAIGDMVVTTSLIRKLKQLKPSLRIGIGCSSRNISLLDEDPAIAKVYNFSYDKWSLLWKELKRARRDGWDLAINCVFVPRTRGAIICRFVVKKGLTGTLTRTRTDRYKNLYSACFQLVSEPYPIPYSEQVCSLVPQLFGFECTGEELRPSLKLSEERVKFVCNDMSRFMAENGARAAVHINVEAANELREWGIDNIFAFCDRVHVVRPDVVFLLTSSPFYSQEIKDRIEGHHDRRIRYYPTKHILDLVALIRCVDVVLSPDTSVIHMASAERKPTVGFFFYRSEWLPYKVPSKIFHPMLGMGVSTLPVEPVAEAVLGFLPPGSEEDTELGVSLLSHASEKADKADAE